METVEQVAKYIAAANKRAEAVVDSSEEHCYARAFGILNGACHVAAVALESIAKKKIDNAPF